MIIMCYALECSLLSFGYQQTMSISSFLGGQERNWGVNDDDINGKYKLMSSSTQLQSYIFCYHDTVPARKATMNEMPTPEIKTTSEILPSSPCTYIEILDDVICAPRAKVRKLVHLGQQMSQISQMLLQDETIGEAKRMAAVHMGEATVQVGLPMSECNEDGISENIRQQLLQFARTNGIVVDFNKARGENQPPIVLVSKYAKSRPDFIMRLATIQHVPEDNEAEDTEAEVVAVTTEHKKRKGIMLASY